MKHFRTSMLDLFGCLLLFTFSCQFKEKEAVATVPVRVPIQEFVPQTFDSSLVAPFFVKYPKFSFLKREVLQLYRKRHYQHLWYDRKGLNEFAKLLYDKANNLDQEGLHIEIPYKERISDLLAKSDNSDKQNLEAELFMSSLYFFYADKVYKGIDAEKSTELGWYLPRNKQSFETRLDSLLLDPKRINSPDKDVLDQYYLLKTALQKYRTIEKKGGWDAIAIPDNMKTLRLGDSSEVIPEVRKRLVVTGELTTDSKSTTFDSELMAGLYKYKEHIGISPDSILTSKNIQIMNIPVSERIKTIMVNMERCRWFSPSLTKSKQFIVVNIPSFTLTYFKDGKPALVSKVVVGKELNETVVFSGDMNQIVFSPYWNVPPSILKNEILPAIAKNSNYLEENDMEWYKDRVRQKPGPKNALGLVKFLFPNSHTIYMHDTPSKTLFNRDSRSFSHGCIRVARPRDLAIMILKDDPKWPVEKIDEAMNAGKEKAYTLKKRIPVFIGYFTAWVGSDGEISFYNDIYNRDERLAELLLSN
ncbi:L,D-transpeptidase family protein [Flavobacterium cellulosilyticum]|uniref:L,D-transpeptidase n=1 Tax=Flavobacterium cellulosilyticum TaxID=2541731 RepID=A0A4R5C766_9FLAO|nr:L,D-transpeptidase family protein [Flavobacterium cellulosilyticum]TDD94549.1 L,D-transpeptidase [Flavobacterium cellulosilyticum]